MHRKAAFSWCMAGAQMVHNDSQRKRRVTEVDLCLVRHESGGFSRVCATVSVWAGERQT
jgi:hypothetical protein